MLLFWARREGFMTNGAEAITVLIICGGHANQKALVGIHAYEHTIDSFICTCVQPITIHDFVY